MATKIVTKNSSTASAVPTASDLVQGELAVNVADKRLFTEDNAGAIVELGTNPSGNVTFQDNGKAIFGAGSDLQIYHDGSMSYIDDAGNGDLRIRASNDISFRNYANEATAMNLSLNNGSELVQLYYAGSQKLATTSTGIDVTGIASVTGSNQHALTIKSDVGTGSYEVGRNQSTGLLEFKGTEATYNGYLFKGPSSDLMTINASGKVGIGTTSPSNKMSITGFNEMTLGFPAVSGGASRSGIKPTVTGAGAGQLEFLVGGDNNNEATTVGMAIDSSGNVGIGTSSPSQLLHLTSGGFAYARLNNSSFTGIDIGQHTGGNVYFNLRDNKDQIFQTNNTERMRIDSSGNLLVGTTDTAPASSGNVVGSSLLAIGKAEHSRDGGVVLALNRKTSDGSIAEFRKDGSTVGSIGSGVGDSSASTLYIADAGNVGLRFDQASTDDIQPCTSAGADRDNAINLGAADNRFKDLYLSGNISTGIGAANANNYQIKVSAGTTGLSRFIAADTSDVGYIDYEHSSDSWIHRTAGAERMRIDANGKIFMNEGFPFAWTDGSLNVSADIYGDSSDNLVFRNTSAKTERMRIDGSGNLLIGKTTTNVAGAGTVIRAGGELFVTRAGDVMNLNRLTSDGVIAIFRKDGTAVGSISCGNSGAYIYFGSSAESVGLGYGGGFVFPTNGATSGSDNSKDLGSPSYRWDDIYATNGTIQTSDFNEKQDIAELSDAEQRVAVACKGLLRKFRWKDSVAEKGDDARIHFGIIAQDLQAAFAAEGLDAGDYAMFISTTWTDEETNEEKTRMGVRYSELLAFIISAI